MSTFTAPSRPDEPYESHLRKAGAVFATRGGRPVAVSYGSPAGELSVCVRAVGLADRSELTKLVLQAPPAQLRHLVGRLAGTELAVGGAVLAGGAWWCGQPDGSVLVLCEPATGVRVRERLLSHSLFHVSLTVSDRSEEWAAIALIGRATPKVLAALHVYGTSGDPRQAAPFTRAAVDGIEASWLLESDHRALALVPRAHATGAWRAIEAAGRPFGISCIGHDAASRYALLERIEQRAA